MKEMPQAHLGIVSHVKDGQALIRLMPQESCGHCGHDTSCGLSRKTGKEVWVSDDIGVSPGMMVRIDISSEGLLSATLILYGIPLFLLLAGAIIGQVIRGEIGSALGAGLGLFTGIPIVRLLSNRVARNKRFVAYVKSVIDEQPAQA